MDDGLRVKGSIAAVGICFVVTVGALAASHLEMLALGATLGIPVGAVLGFRNAPRVARQTTGQAFGSALVMAGQAVLAGDLIVSVTWVLVAMAAAFQGSDSAMDPAALVVAVFALPIIGLLFLGLPAFALAFGVIWPWTFAVRWLGRGRPAATEAATAERLAAGRPG